MIGGGDGAGAAGGTDEAPHSHSQDLQRISRAAGKTEPGLGVGGKQDAPASVLSDIQGEREREREREREISNYIHNQVKMYIKRKIDVLL